jgi:hypothetical protein
MAVTNTGLVTETTIQAERDIAKPVPERPEIGHIARIPIKMTEKS